MGRANPADFILLGECQKIEVIASGKKIREISRLRKIYGQGRWRKLKGTAALKLSDGTICQAEVHWYEAHGVGKRDFKIKKLLK